MTQVFVIFIKIYIMYNSIDVYILMNFDKYVYLYNHYQNQDIEHSITQRYSLVIIPSQLPTSTLHPRQPLIFLLSFLQLSFNEIIQHELFYAWHFFPSALCYCYDTKNLFLSPPCIIPLCRYITVSTIVHLFTY